MKNRFYYYQLLDEREEQLFNKRALKVSISALLCRSYLISFQY